MSNLKTGDRVNYIGKDVQIKAGNPWYVSKVLHGENRAVLKQIFDDGMISDYPVHRVATKNLVRIPEPVKTNYTPKFNVGDSVWAEDYGFGTVTKFIYINDDYHYTVEFCCCTTTLEEKMLKSTDVDVSSVKSEPFAYVKNETSLLTRDEFNNLISEAIEQMQSTLISKGKDYGRNDDPLASFNDYNAITKMTVFQAWSILISKHFQSIMNAIHANPELPECTAEHINERIKDIANYCLLFIPLHEQESRKHRIKDKEYDTNGKLKEDFK